MTQSDAELIERSLSEPEAFVEVFERHGAAVHAYLARRAGAQSAEELLAEVWLQALRGRDGYDPSRDDARPWLYGIARNLLRGHWRTASRRVDATPEPVDDPWDGVDASLDGAASAALLRELLAALPAEQREVLELVAWEELTPQQVGEVLGVPSGTVRWRLHQARARLARV